MLSTVAAQFMIYDSTLMPAESGGEKMLYGLILGATFSVIGTYLFRLADNEEGDQRDKRILIAAIFNILLQAFLIYQYTELRGGFVVNKCVYGLTGALIMGALVLWGSRMLFAFAHEGFRVLLGVAAITAGALGGMGIDMIVAYQSGAALIQSYATAITLCIGAMSILIADIIAMFRIFTPIDIKLLRMLYILANGVGIFMLLAGAVMG